MTKLIGLMGLAGSGKDTAALALLGLKYKRGALAGRVKWLACQVGWDGHKDERGRKFLQDIGSAVRAYNQDYFVDWLERFSVVRQTQRVVITDIRFQNEADWVKSKGGIVIRIVRPEIICGNHESELKQSEVSADYDVVNDSTVEALHEKILQIETIYDQAQNTNAAIPSV